MLFLNVKVNAIAQATHLLHQQRPTPIVKTPLQRYFLIGCNKEPVWGFNEWAAMVGCGIEPLDGPLLIHTAWTGSLDGTLTKKGSVRRDVEALIDSFLVSQDTSRAKLIVWWMDRDPDPEDPLEVRYVCFPTPHMHSLGKCDTGRENSWLLLHGPYCPT